MKGKEDDGESVISDYGTLLEKEAESEEDKPADDDGSESDSSIDIHTPLPCVPPACLVRVVLILCRHLMFRDGLLSPRSKLLPGGGSTTLGCHCTSRRTRTRASAPTVCSVLLRQVRLV